jgi:hypothetical protein
VASRAPSLEALFAEARHSENAADEQLMEGVWEDELPRETIIFPVQSTSVAVEPFNGLPLFATDVAPTVPESTAPASRVVTLAELAQVVRRKPRPKRASQGQLALFGT